MTKGVLFIIKHGDGVILQKRTLDYEKFPGQWTTMGGAIEEGETPEEAAYREVEEELGLNGDLEYYGDIVLEFDKPETMAVFIGEVEDLSLISLGEGVGFAVFTKYELNIIENDIIRRTLKEVMKW